MRCFIFISSFFLLCVAYADDPLDHLSGTEEWDREEELKKQALIQAQRKKLANDEFYQTKARVSSQLSDWQRELSRFQEIKRSIADILFQEESKNYQQVNVKEKLPPKEIKRMPAKGEGVSIETGGPIIEKSEPVIKVAPDPAKPPPIPVVTPSQPIVPQKKESPPPEPTPEEILKKQKGHFDEKGQFIDEELKDESKGKGKKDTDVDYDSP
ncbi:MAG: hypothetical protein ACPL7I_02045 [Myxococcota bacterium]